MSEGGRAVGGRRCTIELFKQAQKFSAAHFTIFSATERERLHGHDYFVSCALTGEVGIDGLIADYGGFKSRIRALCREVDEYLLLPERSPYLQVEREEGFIVAIFNGRRMPFLADEVRVLPIANITLEDLSWYFLERIVEDGGWLRDASISRVEITVGAGPGQSAASVWTAGAAPSS